MIKEAFAVLNSLYFYLLECNIPAKEKEEVVNTLLGFKPLYDSNNWLFNNGDITQSMLSTKPFLPMSLLLQFIDINQWDNVKPLLEDKLSKENTNTIAKAISIFNLNKLLVLDLKWVEDNLAIIFDNIVQNRNLSFDLFSCSASLVPSFVLSLAKNNILVPLLDSEEFRQNSIVYLAHLLVGIVQKNLSSDLKSFIFQAKHLPDSFYYLIKETNNDFLQKHINEIISLLGESVPHIKKECTSLVLLLLQTCSLFKNLKRILISYASALSTNGFSAYYVKKILNVFEKDTFSNKEKINISIFISINIKQCYFYYDDIIRLFDTIDWSNSKEQFDQLLIKYRKIEPDLASELLEAFKKKYQVNRNQ